MAKLILNKDYKGDSAGDIIDVVCWKAKDLANKGIAHYMEKEVLKAELKFDGIEIKPKVKIIRKPRKKKVKKFKW